jgi:hypothetical protein
VGGSGATLNANLELVDGSTLALAGNSLALGSSLTLGNVLLDDATLAEVWALGAGESLTLFSGVDTLVVGGSSYTGAFTTDAARIFANVGEADEYILIYSGSADGVVSIQAVPEPTTATLSLLALAGLVARRRRK